MCSTCPARSRASDIYYQSLDEIARHVDDMEGKVKGDKCFPIIPVCYAIAPLIIWAALYFIQPELVLEKKKISQQKMLQWVVLFTLGAYAVIYVGCRQGWWGICPSFDLLKK